MQPHLPGVAPASPDDFLSAKDAAYALLRQKERNPHAPKWQHNHLHGQNTEWLNSGQSIYLKSGIFMASHHLLRPLTAHATELTKPTDITISMGECLDVLKLVPDNSYDCVVTSPPYYFVRDYGDERQVGLEPTRAAYISRLTEIFVEVKRVMKPSGTCWLNLSDNYCTRRAIRDDGKRTMAKTGKFATSWADSAKAGRVIRGEAQFRAEGIREKSLFNIPHMLIESLMQSGWIYRAEFIWFKTSSVPEKERDGPVCATESIFLLSKASTDYVYNANVLREQGAGRAAEGRPHRNLWEVGPSKFRSDHIATMPEEIAARCILTGSNIGGCILDPFGGAGTTGVAARAFGRSAHLIELNQDYAAVARQRIDAVSLAPGESADWLDRVPEGVALVEGLQLGLDHAETVDAAEAKVEAETEAEAVQDAITPVAASAQATAVLQVRLAAEKEKQDLLLQQLADRDATIADLRRRLDGEAAERRLVQQPLLNWLMEREHAIPFLNNNSRS